MRIIERKEGMLLFSDGIIEENDKFIVVKDGARLLQIEYNWTSSIERLTVDEKEVPMMNESRLIVLKPACLCSHPYPVLKTDKWIVGSPCSSSLYIDAESHNGGISWKEFIDVILGKSLDTLMDGKLSEHYQIAIEFAERTKKVLQEVFQINEAGGPGSRKAVRELLQPLI